MKTDQARVLDAIIFVFITLIVMITSLGGCSVAFCEGEDSGPEDATTSSFHAASSDLDVFVERLEVLSQQAEDIQKKKDAAVLQFRQSNNLETTLSPGDLRKHRATLNEQIARLHQEHADAAKALKKHTQHLQSSKVLDSLSKAVVAGKQIQSDFEKAKTKEEKDKIDSRLHQLSGFLSDYTSASLSSKEAATTSAREERSSAALEKNLIKKDAGKLAEMTVSGLYKDRAKSLMSHYAETLSMKALAASTLQGAGLTAMDAITPGLRAAAWVSTDPTALGQPVAAAGALKDHTQEFLHQTAKAVTKASLAGFVAGAVLTEQGLPQAITTIVVHAMESPKAVEQLAALRASPRPSDPKDLHQRNQEELRLMQSARRVNRRIVEAYSEAAVSAGADVAAAARYAGGASAIGMGIGSITANTIDAHMKTRYDSLYEEDPADQTRRVQLARKIAEHESKRAHVARQSDDRTKIDAAEKMKRSAGEEYRKSVEELEKTHYYHTQKTARLIEKYAQSVQKFKEDQAELIALLDYRKQLESSGRLVDKIPDGYDSAKTEYVKVGDQYVAVPKGSASEFLEIYKDIDLKRLAEREEKLKKDAENIVRKNIAIATAREVAIQEGLAIAKENANLRKMKEKEVAVRAVAMTRTEKIMGTVTRVLHSVKDACKHRTLSPADRDLLALQAGIHDAYHAEMAQKIQQARHDGQSALVKEYEEEVAEMDSQFKQSRETFFAQKADASVVEWIFGKKIVARHQDDPIAMSRLAQQGRKLVETRKTEGEGRVEEIIGEGTAIALKKMWAATSDLLVTPVMDAVVTTAIVGDASKRQGDATVGAAGSMALEKGTTAAMHALGGLDHSRRQVQQIVGHAGAKVLSKIAGVAVSFDDAQRQSDEHVGELLQPVMKAATEHLSSALGMADLAARRNAAAVGEGTTEVVKQAAKAVGEAVDQAAESLTQHVERAEENGIDPGL